MENNEVVWIFGNYFGWDQLGNGMDLKFKLLIFVDVVGQLINDLDVLVGIKKYFDFEWSWY